MSHPKLKQNLFTLFDVGGGGHKKKKKKKEEEELTIYKEL